jgi:predicted Zn-dependent protease
MTTPVPRPERAVDPEAAAALEEGKEHLRQGRMTDAHAAFRRAYRRAPSDPQVYSWFWVTLVLVEKNSTLGTELTDRAVRVAGATPELAMNQSRVAVALRQRERAIRALERGLSRDPTDPVLLAERDALGRRRRPVLPFLHRSNPLNRWLGTLRHRWSTPREGDDREPAVPPRPPGPEQG